MSKSQPPGPEGLPVVGSMMKYAMNPFGLRQKYKEEHGDIVRIQGFKTDGYMLAHPDYIEQVLVGDGEKYRKHDEFENVFGNGLTASTGEFWERQRKLILPSFRPDRIATYTDIMVEHSENVVDTWNDGESYDIEAEMRHLTLEILVDTLLGSGIDYEERGLGESIEAINAKFEPLNRAIPDWLPTKANREYKKGVQNLDRVIHDLIEKRRGDTDGREDLLSMLIDAETDDGTSMSNKTLRDEMMTFLFGGHETSALVLTYTWYLLSKNPEAKEKLRTELDSVLGDDSPSMSDLADLEYTEKVIEESMRLYSPAHTLLRIPKQDTKIGGYDIPEGSLVFLPQWVLHRDDRFYDDPEEFRPSRWTDEMRSELPEYAYFPFGGGKRRCIGDRFAMIESQLSLAAVAQRCDLELVSDEPLELSPGLTAHPKNSVDMIVEKR